MKLTEDQVYEARRRYAAGELIKDIAADLHVSWMTAKRAIRGHYYQRFLRVPPVTGIIHTGAVPRLTEDQVYQIRRRYRDGERQKVLAQEFGVCIKTIHFAVRGGRSTRQGRAGAYTNLDCISPVRMGFAHQARRKLAAHEVLEARTRYARGVPISKLARECGITWANMRKAIKRDTYKWVS